MTYAYWRVSTTEQNEARQIAAFNDCHEKIDRIFGDKMSGKNMDRPQYLEMMSLLQPGDLVIIKSIDRFSRKYDDVAEEWRKIVKVKGADILVLDMPDLLDTRASKDLVGSLISDLVIRLLSYVAETERENIRKRQREGIDVMPVVNGKKVSSKTGRPTGRPPKPVEYVLEDGETVKEACERLGISKTQWYRAIKGAEHSPSDQRLAMPR